MATENGPEEPKLKDLQFAFAAHIRDPERNAAPGDVESLPRPRQEALPSQQKRRRLLAFATPGAMNRVPAGAFFSRQSRLLSAAYACRNGQP